MGNTKKAVMALVAALTLTGGLWAQNSGRGGMGGMFGNMPTMPGLSNPTVGSGAEYLVNAKGKQMDVATVTLGKENVDGATGYWMEMRMNSADINGEMVMKTLTVTTGSETGVKRMIMQQSGRQPMEIDGMMMSMMQRHQPAPTAPSGGTGNGGRGELVGTESVTVPAGTFTAQHYRSQGSNGTTDMWISTDVTPYGMVKMTNADTTMELKKVLTNETSHIRGEPQKMQMPHF